VSRRCSCLVLIPLLALARPACGNPPPDDGPPARTDRHGDPLPPGAVARLGADRFRHGDRIDSLAYSPDGKLLASSSLDGTARLWETSSGREVRRFATGNSVFRVAWSPDGKTLASGGLGLFVHLWDVPTGRERRQLEHLEGVTSLGFSRDGTQVLTAGVAVRLWDVATGREVRRFRGGPALMAAALSPDGRTLVTAGIGQPVVLWDLDTGKEVWRVDVPGSGVDCLAFAPDGKTLAVDCRDQTIRLLGVADGREVRAFRRRPGRAWCVAFSPDGRLLACGGSEVPLRVWEAATGREVPGFRDNPDRPCSLAFAPDGKTLASAGEERVVRFWGIPDGREQFPAGDDSVGPDLLQWSPDGQSLLTRDGQTVDEWGVADWRRGRRFPRKGAGPLAVSPDGKVVATGDEGGDVLLWDRRTGERTARLRGHTAEVLQLAFSDDGGGLLSRGRDGMVLVWEVEKGRLLRQLPAGGAGVAAVLSSPDGRVVAVGREKVFLWDMATGKELGRLEAEGDWFRTAAFTADGRVLVSGSLLGVIQLWRVDGGQELRRWGGGEGSVTALAVSADGRSLATAHPGGGSVYDIRIWERASGGERRHFRGHQGQISSLAFSPDGRLLASASEDRTALLWDTAGPAWRADAGLPAAGLENLWAPLAGDDASAAFDALLTLAAHPADAVPLLRQHLRPVPAVDAGQVAAWVADLDSEEFATRERASRELDRLGEVAVPALTKALAGKPPPEMRRRIERLLDRHGRPEQPAPEGLRQLRAVEALERVGTAEARRLLEELSGGAAEARLTREAKASLRRLAGHPAPEP
jgi:WD40 repeat protein